jgi:hypothetical protein
MSRHTIKNTHLDGNKLDAPEYWCGRTAGGFAFHFMDTHHLALAIGGSIAPCKSCIKAIIKELSKEL